MIPVDNTNVSHPEPTSLFLDIMEKLYILFHNTGSLECLQERYVFKKRKNLTVLVKSRLSYKQNALFIFLPPFKIVLYIKSMSSP